MLTIVIEEVADNDFTVTVGDRYADRLTRDEAAALAMAVLFKSPVVPPWLTTKDQHDRRERARQERLAHRSST